MVVANRIQNIAASELASIANDLHNNHLHFATLGYIKSQPSSYFAQCFKIEMENVLQRRYAWLFERFSVMNLNEINEFAVIRFSLVIRLVYCYVFINLLRASVPLFFDVSMFPEFLISSFAYFPNPSAFWCFMYFMSCLSTFFVNSVFVYLSFGKQLVVINFIKQYELIFSLSHALEKGLTENTFRKLQNIANVLFYLVVVSNAVTVLACFGMEFWAYFTIRQITFLSLAGSANLVISLYFINGIYSCFIIQFMLICVMFTTRLNGLKERLQNYITSKAYRGIEVEKMIATYAVIVADVRKVNQLAKYILFVIYSSIAPCVSLLLMVSIEQTREKSKNLYVSAMMTIGVGGIFLSSFFVLASLTGQLKVTKKLLSRSLFSKQAGDGQKLQITHTERFKFCFLLAANSNRLFGLSIVNFGTVTKMAFMKLIAMLVRYCILSEKLRARFNN